MPTNETTTKFRVDISDLKRGIQDANRQIKLANAQFKAASSGMDDWAHSSDGISTKLKSLDKVLGSQKTILSNYEKQLELIVKEYGENSKEADEMRIKIANQQTAVNKTTAEIAKYTERLNELEQEQNDAAESAKKQGSAYDDLKSKIDAQEQELSDLKQRYKEAVIAEGENSESAKKLGKEIKDLSGELKDSKSALKNADDAADKLDGSFEETGQSAATFGDVLKANVLSDVVREGFNLLKRAVEELAGAMREAITEAVAYGDEILTLAAQTGLSTEALQEYYYMSDLIDVSVDTITGSMTKLIRNMNSAREGTGAAAEAFEALGISVTDANGNLRSHDEVFSEVIDALGQMQNETERDATAMALLGRSAMDLNPMIVAGSDAIEAFRQEAHDMGYVLENDDLTALGETQDSFDRLQRQMETVKRKLVVALAPAISEVADRFMEWVQNVDWDVVITKVEEIIDVVADVVNFVIEHKNMILVALAAITTAIIAMTAAQWAMNVAMNANPIGLIITLIGLLIGVFVALEAKFHMFANFFRETWEQLKEVVGTIVEGIKNFFIAAAEKIQEIWGRITGFFSRVWEGIKNVFLTVANFFRDRFQAAFNLVTTIWNAITGFFSRIWNGIKTVFSAVGNFFRERFETAFNAVRTVWGAVTGFFQGLWDGIVRIFSNVGNFFRTVFEGAKNIVSNIIGGIVAVIKAPINGIISLINVFIRGLNRIRIPDWVPVVGGRGIHINELSYLASGGVLARGQVGILEGSGAEAVVPLENNAKWIAATARDLKAELEAEGIIAGRGDAGQRNVVNNYNYVQNNTSPKALSRLDIYRQTRNQLNFAKG